MDVRSIRHARRWRRLESKPVDQARSDDYQTAHHSFDTNLQHLSLSGATRAERSIRHASQPTFQDVVAHHREVTLRIAGREARLREGRHDSEAAVKPVQLSHPNANNDRRDGQLAPPFGVLTHAGRCYLCGPNDRN